MQGVRRDVCERVYEVRSGLCVCVRGCERCVSKRSGEDFVVN